MDLNDIIKKVSEVSEKYSNTYAINRNSDWYILKLQEEVGELVQSYLSMTNRSRKQGDTPQELKAKFANELVDVLGQVFLITRYNNIDLNKAFESKWFKHLNNESSDCVSRNV